METGAARREEGEEPAQQGEAPPFAHTASRRLWPSRELVSKLALELFVVFIGVSAAFAVDDYRKMRTENERRNAVYLALDRELTQMAETHGPGFQREMTRQLGAGIRLWREVRSRFRRASGFPPPSGHRPASGTRP